MGRCWQLKGRGGAGGGRRTGVGTPVSAVVGESKEGARNLEGCRDKVKWQAGSGGAKCKGRCKTISTVDIGRKGGAARGHGGPKPPGHVAKGWRTGGNEKH